MSFDHFDSDSMSAHMLAARSIFKRCVKCESSAPSCPTCDEGYTCTMISQSCNQCATTKCIQTSSSTGSGSKSSGSSGGGSNAGAIAGGVIGGLVFVTVIVGLIWWFVIRKKRNDYGQGSPSNRAGSPGSPTGQEKRSGSLAQQARKSTHSIASTVLTRASNVIQIAYIPGVTNRSPPDTPSSLIPPVPPLPGAAPDQHFFMPGDLRDSSFTEMTTDRRSGAPSISPSLRSSVATTVYRNNAIISPIPAQQAMRTRAAVVSIHGNQQPTTATQTAVITPPDAPAVPAITSAQLAKAGVTDANAATTTGSNNNNSSIVGRTMMAKPVMVKMLGGKKKNNSKENSAPVQTIEERSESSAPNTAPNSAAMSLNTSIHEQPVGGEHFASGFDDSSDDEPDSPGTQSVRIVKRSDTAKTSGSKSPVVARHTSTATTAEQSPFADQSSVVPPPRVQSPFSDANEVK